jgi:hypothetical protein
MLEEVIKLLELKKESFLLQDSAGNLKKPELGGEGKIVSSDLVDQKICQLMFGTVKPGNREFRLALQILNVVDRLAEPMTRKRMRDEFKESLTFFNWKNAKS